VGEAASRSVATYDQGGRVLTSDRSVRPSSDRRDDRYLPLMDNIHLHCDETNSHYDLYFEERNFECEVNVADRLVATIC